MRQERIDSIIQRRKPLAERVHVVLGRLNQVIDNFEKFRFLCRNTLQDKYLASEFGELSRICDDSNRFMTEAAAIREDLARIRNRLSRDTLNIAVIGRARQGKSRLLQSITGLTTEEIPDGRHEFCTGVRSDIINEPSAKSAYAVVHFLTEERFISENVAPYFEELQKCKPNLFPPLSVADFKNYRLPAPGTINVSPENSTQMNLHLEHLKELQAHLPQYQDYLGKGELRISGKEIREYVAQDNINGERVFFKHMAVDNVEIYCRFPNTDVGALRLIDLPGLGDTRLGDVERVVKALRDQVDLVLFLSKPAHTGAGWQDNEVQLYSQARRALGEKLPIQRWAFWVFNHDSSAGADNKTQCDLMRNSMSAAQINVAETVTVDCANPGEVSRKLIDPALEHLAENIDRNDREYAENLQSALTTAMQNLRALLERARDLLREEGDFDRDSGTFDMLFDDIWDSLREEIQGCVEEGSELRQNRDVPCEPLRERIESILTEEESGTMPVSEEDIRRAARRMGGLGSAFEDALHQLRTRLSSKMQENLDDILDGVLTGMKDKLCSIMGETGRLGNHFRDEKGRSLSDHRLLKALIDFCAVYKREMPTLIEGFCLLEGWKMSYRSFIQHRLRSSLNGLDPLDEECTSMGSPTNESQAIEILQGLYQQTIYKLRQAFDDIYSEPNKAAFAVAEEFKDVMIRPHDTKEQGPRLVNQWRQLYRSIRGDVWPEEYGSSQRRRDACAKLRVPLQVLIPLCISSNFDFLG